MIAEGGGFCDAVFFVHAHRAVETGDDKALREVAELAAAFAPSKERHLETTAQGARLRRGDARRWPCAALDRLAAAWDGPVAYPVAVGVAAAGHGVALEPALGAYLHAVVANLISAGVRLIPLGQTDGQRLLAAFEPIVTATAARALSRRSIRSAARPSAPTSPACGMRRSTRGCSAHDHAGGHRLSHARRDCGGACRVGFRHELAGGEP